jgi:hypothetical protein
MTFWLSDKEAKYALCASETEALLAEVTGGKKEAFSVRNISTALRDKGDEIAVKRLFASTGRKKAKVALVLPLSSFEIVSVTVPAVNLEAVARLLPYNLSKVLASPVNDYIYDWQVVQTFAERQELTVYLYSVAMFNKLQQDLQERQKEITWFEADVFSACSYLELCGLGEGDGAVLCVLIWQGSISIAVYELGRISMARSVDLCLPDESYYEEDLSSDITEVEVQNAGQEVAATGETISGMDRGQEMLAVEVFDLVETDEAGQSGTFQDEEDILTGFFSLQDNKSEPVIAVNSDAACPTEVEAENLGPPGRQKWQEYMQNINLEIMRTNDYNVSVLKGKPFNKIYIGGAESFYPALEQVIKGAIGTQVEKFPPLKVAADCDQTLAALCVGALRR